VHPVSRSKIHVGCNHSLSVRWVDGVLRDPESAHVRLTRGFSGAAQRTVRCNPVLAGHATVVHSDCAVVERRRRDELEPSRAG